ncbi:MAG: acetylornithine transaminase [Planctomycetota bacterium]|nr:acetylornithine transaminase [Planctomycetota bacterium]MCX8039402.1 acetylornithine transaminase [Planctomycetota bacterium]MDW8373322.1 acetylornithine transaminase [Planctomycetota bacterium]
MPQPLPPCPHLAQNYARQPVRFVRGQGVWLYDEQGRAYLDGFAGVAVSCLGHAHPALVRAISEQAATLLHTSNHYHHPLQERLAERLARLSGLPRAFFCNSGTEANEAALKLARLWSRAQGGSRPRLLACEGSFHGRTLGSLALTHTPKYREPFAPLPAVDFVPFGDAEALARAIDARVAAVFVEPIQGEGGVRVPPPGYLARVRELCTQHGALLVADEVQTGIGRTGRMFACEHEGVRPDVLCLAKGLGGGVPIGAVLMQEEVAALLGPGLHGTTFGGNQLACAAALAVLAVVDDPALLAAVRAHGERLRRRLAEIFPEALAVRGQGLLIGVQLPYDPAPLIAAGLDHGVVVGPAAGQVLRLAPPLIISAAECDELCARLAAARAALDGARAAAG